MSRSRDAELRVLRDLVREALAGQAAPGDHASDEAMASYIEGCLPEPAVESFEHHVALCSECAAELVLARRAAEAAAERRGFSGWKVAAGLALVVAGALAAMLAGREIGDSLERRVVAGVERSFGGKVAVEGAELSFAGGPGVRLSGLVLRDPAGGEPLLTAPRASFAVAPSGVLAGEVKGTLELEHPVIRVVRELNGRVNVDALLPKAARRGALSGTVAVDSVVVHDGRIRIVDRLGGSAREVRVAAVDAALHGLAQEAPAELELRGGLESAEQNLSLHGAVGPWGGGVTPSYVLDRVSLASVPMSAWPRVSESIGGALSFDGRLATAGETWAELTGRLAGRGDLRVVSGSLRGRNLVASVVDPIVPVADVASRVGLIAAAETAFDELSSPVEIASTGLEADALRVRGPGYEVTGRGSLAADGRLAFEGRLEIAPEVSRELVALVPAAAELLGARGTLAIPFRLAGAWPAVEATVDLDHLVARALAGRGLARLPALLAAAGSPRA